MRILIYRHPGRPFGKLLSTKIQNRTYKHCYFVYLSLYIKNNYSQPALIEKNMIRPLLFLLLTLPAGVWAQAYLGDDMPFFQKKGGLFQHWLESKQMSKALKVDQVRLKNNGYELELWLAMASADPDEGAALWKTLQRSFQASNPQSSIETALFDTFVRMMEIPATQGNVQIYLPSEDGSGYSPCFYVWIWEENGEVLTEQNVNSCRAQPLEIEVELPAVKQAQPSSSVRFNFAEERRKAFSRIISYVEKRYRIDAAKRYKTEGCHERMPVIDTLVGEYTLKIEVQDLCREVLTLEKKSLWCRFVEQWWGPCNDIRRERLEFTFIYHPTEEGYMLTGSLTGKFGSGVYKPRTSGYMDMEPDFEEDFLKPYVQRFNNDLKKYLEAHP